MTGQNSLPNLRLMGQDFFVVVYVACNGVDIIACLPLCKPGKRDTLEMVAHKQADILLTLAPPICALV